MKYGPVTARYAEALFELARDKGLLTEIAADVEFLKGEMSDPDVSRFLLDASVTPAEKLARVGFLEKHVQPLTFNFVRLLLDKRRIEVLSDLGEAFQDRMLRETGAARGTVECARPLDDGDLASLAAQLGARVGKTVTLEQRVVPDLIGGVRVFLENKMLDLSIQGQLDGLRDHLLGARLSG